MKKNWFIVLSGVVVGFLLLGWTFKPATFKHIFNNGSPKQVNVLLIVLDAQRADHLSCYGYSRKTSPNIDEIASRGLVFENVFAPLPMTQPSFASMFTSLYPQSHGIKRNDLALSPKAETLAEILHAHGWNTAAVIGASNLDSVFGFNQGFELYEDSMGRKLDPEIKVVEHMKRWERKAEEVNRIAFRWLDHRKSGSPFFLFLHYYDPHKPYAPPPPFDRKYDQGSDEKSKIRALYDGEVSYLDEQLGLLFRKLGKMNLMQNTLVLITADHGEGLGDHNWQGHIWKIYDEAVRVPLIIAGPGIRKGQHVPQLVENVDYSPSILEYLKIEKPSQFQGVSFWPAVENSQTVRNYVLLEKAKPPWNLPQLNPEWQKFPYAQWAIRTKTEKFIWSSDKKHEYYDLTRDPGELHNLFSTERQQALALFRKGVEYRSHFGRLALGVAPVRTIEGNDPDEALRALGYVN
jgi:arylsulfatase A-like enzyme